VSDPDDSGGADAPRIHALDPSTVDRIAAGEVVERPASVVKELVENSLDADASRVAVAVGEGGTERVRVRDDGVGMTREELRLAVREHTTSKIRDIDDLEAGVGTLGFRGEALHTIGAVSRTAIRSKPRGADGAGAELRIEGGEVGDVEPAGCPEGTTVEVTDLFYNTPARRKFLKTTATEFDHVSTVVTQYALANPNVAVSLAHDGREVFATEGRGDLRSTVLSVYGREVAEAMTEVSWTADRGPVESVSGLASHPETTRAGREYLSTFVNGRYVTAGTLRDAALEAYGGQLAPDRYPFAVLFVDVPPEAVDVNVHPRKMEVRFDDADGVHDAVEAAVRDALLEAGIVRSSAPRGRSAPDEAAVEPARSGRESTESGGATGAADPTDGPSTTDATGETGGTDAGDGPGPTAGSDGDPVPGATAAGATDASESGATGRQDGGNGGAPADAAAGDGGPADAGTGVRSTPGTDVVDDARPGRAGTPEAEDAGAGSHGGGTGTADRRLSGPTTQRTLDGDDAAAEASFDSLPRMRVLGQLHDTYVVAETDAGLVLIDQHAADERVNYERLRETVSGDTATQALASPVELELTAREAALFEEYREALAQVGFHATRTDERHVAVRTVPAVFGDALDPDLLRDVLTAFVRDGTDGAETVDAAADALLADLACYPSVTGNTSLTEGSVVDLLDALDDCENPYACPHGRPVVVRVDSEEIEDRFERDYPGHAGRRREDP
jgi:DNA mismatch repair protein MutL